MITKFHIFEEIESTPDVIEVDGKEHYDSDNDARPFEWDSREEKVLLFGYGTNHPVIGDAYPGRIWDSVKVMVFWVYPDEETFKKICNSFEKDHGIKILNNGWRIVVIKSDEGIKRKEEGEHLYAEEDWRSGRVDLYTEIIPVEEYAGQSIDVPKEVYLQHILSPLKKRQEKPQGWKRKHIKYQLPGEPEIVAKRRLKYLYQEMITLFEEYQTTVINIKLDGDEYVFTIKKEGKKVFLMDGDEIYQRIDIQIPDSEELEEDEFFMAPDVRNEIIKELEDQGFIEKLDRTSIAGDKKVQAYKL